MSSVPMPRLRKSGNTRTAQMYPTRSPPRFIRSSHAWPTGKSCRSATSIRFSPRMWRANASSKISRWCEYMPNHSSCGRSSARHRRISTSATTAARRTARGAWTSCSMDGLRLTRTLLDQTQVPPEQRLVDCPPGIFVCFRTAQKIERSCRIAGDGLLDGMCHDEFAGAVARECRVESAEVEDGSAGRVVAVERCCEVASKCERVHSEQPMLQEAASRLAVKLRQVTLQHALFATLPPAGSMQFDERFEQPLEALRRHTLDRDRQSVTLRPSTQILDLFHDVVWYGLIQAADAWTEREDRSHTSWRRLSGAPGQRRRFEECAIRTQVLELAHIPAVAVLSQVRPQRVEHGRPLVRFDQDALIVGDAGAHERQDSLGAARVHQEGRRADQASAAPEQDEPWLVDSERSAPRNQPIRMLKDARF